MKYARQDVRFLRSFDLKAILIACGTVTTTSLAALQAENDLPMVGVVEPTCRRAVLMTQNKRVGAHRHGGLRPLRCLRGGSPAAGPGGDRVQPGLPPVRAPGGGRAHPAGRRGDRDRGPGVSDAPEECGGWTPLILGCTHYPLLTDVIGDVMGPGVELVSAGEESAFELKRMLKARGAAGGRAPPRETEFYVSDRVEDFERTASLFLQEDLRHTARRIDIERY